MTYIQESLNNGRISRWEKSDFPLPFHMEHCRWYAANGDEDKYDHLVIRGLKEWESRTNGLVSFRFVDNLMDSKVNLTWKRVDRKSLGQCRFEFDRSRFFSAEVEIGLSDGIIHREYMDDNEVYHTILHELGHAVGLGHSKTKNDIMYVPHQYGMTNISENDIKTLEYMYALPIGLGIKQMNEQFGIYLNNFDDIIAKIEEKYASEDNYYQERQQNRPNTTNGRSLSEENERLAELKKYTMTIQNLNISVNPYFKKPQYKPPQK